MADTIAELPSNHDITITKNEQALNNQNKDCDALICSHEEADTRMFVHVRHAAIAGSRTVTLKVNDTDILVIAVALFSTLQLDGLEELWLDFGTSTNQQIIPVHDVVANLGQDICDGLLFFHAFTGCDTVSATRKKGKRTWYNTWRAFPEISAVFSRLSNSPTNVSTSDIDLLQRFVILAYDKNSQCTNVDETRLELFAHKNRPYDSIPSTLAALTEHISRAAFQAGWV